MTDIPEGLLDEATETTTHTRPAYVVEGQRLELWHRHLALKHFLVAPGGYLTADAVNRAIDLEWPPAG